MKLRTIHMMKVNAPSLRYKIFHS